MNRYQAGALVGGICVAILVVVLIVWATYLVRESVARRRRERVAEARENADWERKTESVNGVLYVRIVRMARPVGAMAEQVGEPVLIGTVAMADEDWLIKVSDLKTLADDRVFQLNLESLG